MFKKILFATTASPACHAAAKIAFELAEKYKSELVLFHVYGVPSHGSSFSITDYLTGEQNDTGPEYAEYVKDERIRQVLKDLAAEELEHIAKLDNADRLWAMVDEILHFVRGDRAARWTSPCPPRNNCFISVADRQKLPSICNPVNTPFSYCWAI